MSHPTTASPRSAQLCFALAAALALIGLALLGHDPRPGAPIPQEALQSPPRIAPSASSAANTHSPPPATGRAQTGASGLPVPGDGPAGDHAVQRLLDRFSPADLPPAQERDLVRLASQIWKADVTGRGRSRWPRYFAPGAHETTGTRGVYADVRIQAGIARKASSGSRITVRLVWAGTDPSGTRRDGRLAVLLFRHDPHHPKSWEPVR